ncbi:MAG: SDR family oxidoreductase [Bacteroidia bacterium]|nr:SDR family oxidoreductase [Bacteroidia bacterium]
MENKKILITGSNGLLGQKIIYQLLQYPHGFEIYATGRGENRLAVKSGYHYHSADLTNKESVQELIGKIKPHCVIHTAAMTNVDACELQPDECRKQNVDAVQFLIDALEKIKTKSFSPHFIFLSTDFIFDGTHGPLDENEKPNPLSTYARSKLDAENIVRNSMLDWAIARTVLVYGVTDNMSRSNIVLWVKNNLEQGKEISVVTDQYRTPTLAEDLADGCIRIAAKRAKGVFNISGKDFMNIFELAKRVAHYFNLDERLIKPSLSSDIKQPAKRPPVTGFIIEKARKELGYEPHTFEEGIKIMMDQIQSLNPK